LVKNLHSLGSYVFVNGRTVDHAFPDNLLEALETRILQIQEATDDCLDFLILDDQRLLLLDRIRIEIRELEVNYTDWYFNSLPEHDTKLHTLYTASVLNRLSAYLFNVIRYEHLGMPEKHWQGKITLFKPPI
jgi:cob(I)alamin adenosyltransferase